MSDETINSRSESIVCPPGYLNAYWYMREGTKLTDLTASPPPPLPFLPNRITTLTEQKSEDVPGSKHNWKPFQHYKCKLEQSTMSPQLWFPSTDLLSDPSGDNAQHEYARCGFDSVYYALSGFGMETGGFPLEGLPEFKVTLPNGDFVPKAPGSDEMVDRAVRSMMPLIKAELSSVNSVIELKDFVSLPHTIRSVVQLGLKAGTRTLRNFLRVGSDLYLQKKFNIDPLLSDVSGIHRALQRTEARINELVARSAKLRLLHRAYDVDEFPIADDDVHGPYTMSGFYPIPSIWGANRTYRTVSSLATKFHVEIEYNFHYAQYQRENARMLALLDAMGVNLNPQIIWNAIPWSFVVDWVIGVGQWLDQFKIANMDPVINIQRFLYSVKRSRSVTISRTIGETGRPWVSFLSKVPVARFLESSYRRDTGFPAISSITGSGVNLNEFTLGAALVFSRGKRHPHKWHRQR